MRKKTRRHIKKTRKTGLPPGTLLYTGRHTQSPTRVFTISYNESDYSERNHYEPALYTRAGSVCWVDICSLTDTELIERVGQDFDIHPLALEDVLDTQQRAKLEEYDNGLFLILPNSRFDKDNLDILNEQIAVFVGPDLVVSFQEDPDDTLAAVRRRAHDSVGRIRKKSSDYLAYAIADAIVDNYYTVIDDIASKLLEIEERLHKQGAEPEAKAQIFDMKRVVNEFRNRVLPMRDASIRFYRTESELLDESNRLYLRDVADHVAQIIDSLDNQRDTLNSLEALFHAEAASRLNNVMRLLTVISTIFIPLSFIASLYGMNFDNMPELHSQYGYYVVLGVMFTAMVGMLVYFRWKRWI
ncbi:MAG TPA: magnesium/cobalt transporter CorA [Saprospiraceae bacterium]|nr:magnesium/cobalt transporter CorA [Saprospiraceae bacterium]